MSPPRNRCRASTRSPRQVGSPAFWPDLVVVTRAYLVTLRRLHRDAPTREAGDLLLLQQQETAELLRRAGREGAPA